jgi:murein DD-endopeptidase MepM/ murein hydrolase activator NlpD
MRPTSCILLAVLAGLPAAARAQLTLEFDDQPPAKVLPQKTSLPLDGVMPPSGGLVSGGPAEESECITAWQRREIERQIAMHARVYGPVQNSADGPALYPFYPQACNLYRDSSVGNFVDLNGAPGVVQTHDCGVMSYDGHHGIDTPIRSFSEQAIGVPVFAALDGTVVARADGNPDMNTTCTGNPNYVILDHGGGRHTWYLHMRNGSVAVALNQQVHAGQQLGLVASSGCSSWPHLHFESRQNNTDYEPFAGPCRAGPSGWVVQQDPPPAPFMSEWGVTTTNIAQLPPSPTRLPNQGQFALSDPVLTFYWMHIGSLPANATWQFVFVRPDGTTAFTSQVGNFNNIRPLGFFRAAFGWNIPEMRTIAGTWQVRVLVSGQELIDAPVLVVESAMPGFNRPPEPISVAFDPAIPAPGQVLFCRVGTSLTLDDLDGDLVRYTYTWERNGVQIRSLTSAGHADAIQAGDTAARDIIRCTVTPSDGIASGATVSVAVDVGCYANCDASTGNPSLTANDFQCFINTFAANNPYANCDGSTGVPALTANDFQCFVNQFAGGCT